MVDPVRKVVVVSYSRVSRGRPVVQLQRGQRSAAARAAAAVATETLQ